MLPSRTCVRCVAARYDCLCSPNACVHERQICCRYSDGAADEVYEHRSQAQRAEAASGGRATIAARAPSRRLREGRALRESLPASSHLQSSSDSGAAIGGNRQRLWRGAQGRAAAELGGQRQGWEDWHAVVSVRAHRVSAVS